MHVKIAIQKILRIIESLKTKYPDKKFTIDGRLLGDLGEVLVAELYNIKLYKGIAAYYDGETTDGKKVQIKTTMKNSLTFPASHVPDYYLGVKFDEKGNLEEVYNGPGKLIKEVLKNRVRTSNNLHSVSLSRLKKLNLEVANEDKI